jgi:hypothetical protein
MFVTDNAQAPRRRAEAITLVETAKLFVANAKSNGHHVPKANSGAVCCKRGAHLSTRALLFRGRCFRLLFRDRCFVVVVFMMNSRERTRGTGRLDSR